ncbi:MAG: zinc ABC transporter solute-binding protein [bacterium]|nr:zinc ABC transporter solute-binding protein [bacterium]
MKKIFIVLPILLISFSINGEEQACNLKVITTTSWTASFAKAAGAKDITILAPVEMAHPPEYELKPSDIQALTEADVIIYAGYEGMVDKLLKTATSKDIKAIKIHTSNNMAAISSSLRIIASCLGTEDYGEISIDKISIFFEEWRNELKIAGVYGKNATVHFFQQDIARELGFNVISVFGPTPPEAKDLLSIKNSNSPYIIDNIHGAVGKSLKEILPGTAYITFRNFPTDNSRISLLDILVENRSNFKKIIH